MTPKTCKGCGRRWSDPIPVNCPECGETLLVVDVTTADDGLTFTMTEGSFTDPTPLVGSTTEPDPTLTPDMPEYQPGAPAPSSTYYCVRCQVNHKTDSQIGIAHAG